MSADDLEDFYVHTATVETFQGTNGYGEDTYADPVDVPGFLTDVRKLVLNADGEQVTSEAQFFTYPDRAPLFLAKSRVTVNGNPSLVIRSNLNTSGDLDLPDHVAISLT